MTESSSNFLQVLTPPDEFAKHGKHFMCVATNIRANRLYVDGEPINEGEPLYICEACLLEKFTKVERRKKNLEDILIRIYSFCENAHSDKTKALQAIRQACLDGEADRLTYEMLEKDGLTK